MGEIDRPSSDGRLRPQQVRFKNCMKMINVSEGVKKAILQLPILILIFLGNAYSQENDIIPAIDKSHFIVKFSRASNMSARQLNNSGLFGNLKVRQVKPLRNDKLKGRNTKPSVLDGIFKISIEETFTKT